MKKIKIKSKYEEFDSINKFTTSEAKEYPKTVVECIDEKIEFDPKIISLLEDFKKLKPWSGTMNEMREKLCNLNVELSKALNIAPPQIVFVRRFPIGSCCFPTSIPKIIVLEPTRHKNYSICTYLHEFGHILGKNEEQTCKWSLNLFKIVFSKEYSKLKPKGHLLYKIDDTKQMSTFFKGFLYSAAFCTGVFLTYLLCNLF